MILIFFLELAIFYLIIYSLIKADKWVKAQCNLVNEKGPTVLDAVSALKSEFIKLNKTFQTKFLPRPFSLKEFNDFITEIITDLLKSFIPGFSFKRKLIALKIIYKLIRNKRRLAATFLKN